MTIYDLIARTPVGQTVEFEPERRPATQSVRFYQIGPNYKYPHGEFSWTSRPRGAFPPHARNLVLPSTPVETFAPYEFSYFGLKDELPDLYKIGSMFAVSERVLSAIQSIDPTGVECAPGLMTVGSEVLNWNACIPSRSLCAVEVSATKVSISKKQASRGELVTAYAPSVFSFNSEIPFDIHIFWDVVEPRMFWSAELVNLCVQSGVKGVLAWAGYISEPHSVEM